MIGAICAWTLLPDMDVQLEKESVRFENPLKQSGYRIGTVGESMNDNLKFSVYEPDELSE